MHKRIISICFLLLLFSLGVLARNGSIQGVISDAGTGELIPFAISQSLKTISLATGEPSPTQRERLASTSSIHQFCSDNYQAMPLRILMSFQFLLPNTMRREKVVSSKRKPTECSMNLPKVKT